jgi:hypothetical protein
MDTKAIPSMLRKIASSLRAKAEEIENYRTVKSAQVLVAAQGLSKLAKILCGEAK